VQTSAVSRSRNYRASKSREADRRGKKGRRARRCVFSFSPFLSFAEVVLPETDQSIPWDSLRTAQHGHQALLDQRQALRQDFGRVDQGSSIPLPSFRSFHPLTQSPCFNAEHRRPRSGQARQAPLRPRGRRRRVEVGSDDLRRTLSRPYEVEVEEEVT
jgi:hypothetical protein